MSQNAKGVLLQQLITGIPDERTKRIIHIEEIGKLVSGRNCPPGLVELTRENLFEQDIVEAAEPVQKDGQHIPGI
ncbi:hypothetical protein [Desulfovibrio inopinatus]|uniref:hypothetical protein n=1 Tax=Desulfovibrio inopinatus TaxID=102109 RepID=UPI001FE1E2B5|nr:hypothetical protein [Desulfovibrio inopinatus]